MTPEEQMDYEINKDDINESLDKKADDQELEANADYGV